MYDYRAPRWRITWPEFSYTILPLIVALWSSAWSLFTFALVVAVIVPALVAAKRSAELPGV
jgi:peptidoglycan/LPS O-acetylase OafA/YrhL